MRGFTLKNYLKDVCLGMLTIGIIYYIIGIEDYLFIWCGITATALTIRRARLEQEDKE